MGLKAFMLIVLAIFLAITSEVAARELSQSSTTSPDKGHANEVNDAKFLGIGGPGAEIPGIGGLPIPRIPGIGELPRPGSGGESGGGSGYYNSYTGEGYGEYYPADGYGGGYRRGGWYGRFPRN
ncbi:glycine-rich cell wall structural protein isoform X3 [Capsicum annuum]|uniref:glycine-rich cell wall structural protein isoform X3 n=1 Tax=Capsicum annuum TaxID=4072 RepID=UPI0007BF8E39|nr:glycine-rich cell wall structural protein isoform X3 [Capsicum annuum]